MRKVWIVVANSSHAKIYTAKNTHTLIEHQTFVHNESHMHAGDLVSDRQGRETSRFGYGTDTMEEKTSIKDKEASAFAVEIAHFLEKGFHAQAFERLYLIAKPPFLGFLRNALHANISKLIEAEIQKDLIQLSPEEVREYLPPVL